MPFPAMPTAKERIRRVSPLHINHDQVDLHAAVLFAPAKERLLHDAQLPAYLSNRAPLRGQHLRLAQLVDDLL